MTLAWRAAAAVLQAQRIVDSHRLLTGRDLLPAGVRDAAAVAAALQHSPLVVVSHGLEADPVLNYGNAAALALWEMPWDMFTRTPSRLTAEAPERGERERLLAAVSSQGFVDDYAGVRVSGTGRRFMIEQATVWNLLDERGARCGQAAAFAVWRYL